MVGLHIIADFNEVNFSKIKINEEIIKEYISNSLKKHGLVELGSFYHCFKNNNELTGVIALAESHVNFHTWPEKSYVSIDIFVCNYNEDNSEKAKKLYTDLKKLFSPGKIDDKFITRESN